MNKIQIVFLVLFCVTILLSRRCRAVIMDNELAISMIHFGSNTSFK